MAIAYNTSIVRSGLVLQLDAANTKSYPGSGTAWTDLTGRGNGATLVNSPTYSNGYFTLNGTTQYASVATTPLTATNTCTILMWIYSAASQPAYTGLFYNRSANGICGMSFQSNSRLSWTWNSDPTSYNYAGTAAPTNSWCMAAISVGATQTTFWINSTSTTQTYTTANQTFDAISIGQDTAVGNRFFNGRVSYASLYNRALSDAEITQNFNAMRGRYGV